jgi:hypothetical protein
VRAIQAAAGLLLFAIVAIADKAPIAGSVTAVDADARTVTLDTTAQGRRARWWCTSSQERRSCRFVRATEAGKTGLVEQPLPLAALKPGWIVSVEPKHDGDRKVAELVKVVLER